MAPAEPPVRQTGCSSGVSYARIFQELKNFQNGYDADDGGQTDQTLQWHLYRRITEALQQLKLEIYK
jgi:hypothetical protein